MSEKPEEPDFDSLEESLNLSPMDEEAVQMNELFKSLSRAGFRENQALTLVAMIVNDMHEQTTIINYVEDEEDDEDPDMSAD